MSSGLREESAGGGSGWVFFKDVPRAGLIFSREMYLIMPRRRLMDP